MDPFYPIWWLLSGAWKCTFFGHKWYPVCYYQKWHETHRDEEGRPQGSIATYASLVCRRCTYDEITRGSRFEHMGFMSPSEKSYEVGE